MQVRLPVHRSMLHGGYLVLRLTDLQVNGIANYLIRIFGSLGLEGVMPLLVYGTYIRISIISGQLLTLKSHILGRRNSSSISCVLHYGYVRSTYTFP